MGSNVTLRRSNGKRLEGKGLAIRMSQEIKGMMLAQAFIMLKSAGFILSVHKLDDEVISKHAAIDNAIIVDVTNGVVKVAWVK